MFVLAMLALDLFVFGGRKSHRVSVREALAWVIAWVSLALLFAGLLWWYLNDTVGAEIAQRKTLEFLAGYLIEQSLSVRQHVCLRDDLRLLRSTARVATAGASIRRARRHSHARGDDTRRGLAGDTVRLAVVCLRRISGSHGHQDADLRRARAGCEEPAAALAAQPSASSHEFHGESFFVSGATAYSGRRQCSLFWYW